MTSAMKMLRRLSKILLWMLVDNLLRHCVAELREYCFPNAFNVTCNRDEVIVMTSARYGRMSRGQCLSSDYQIGCWADVLQHVDRRCSGRRHCTVAIPDTILHNLHPCQKDLLAYLESEHICQKVQTRPVFPPCQHVGVIQLPASDSPQYLASSVTHDHGFGSTRCPWMLVAPRGRRLNITLMDFGVATRYTAAGTAAAEQTSADLCHVYARIRELPSVTGSTGSGSQEGGQQETIMPIGQEIPICAGRSRERIVFMSESERVEITIVTGSKNTPDPAYFLLKYHAIGCADPLVPRGAWLRRAGDKATVACNFTTQTWHIVCQQDGWFGTIDNCTVETLTARSSTLSADMEQDRILPVGVLIAILFGLLLGVVMGVVLLAVVMSCHRRLQRLKAPPSELHPVYGECRRDNLLSTTTTATNCRNNDQLLFHCPEHEAMCARYTVRQALCNRQLHQQQQQQLHQQQQHPVSGGSFVRYQSDNSSDQMSPL